MVNVNDKMNANVRKLNVRCVAHRYRSAVAYGAQCDMWLPTAGQVLWIPHILEWIVATGLRFHVASSDKLWMSDNPTTNNQLVIMLATHG